MNTFSTHPSHADLIDSSYAARRLFITLLLMTLGGSSMYVVSVVLPEVQKEFGISRADASLPYTLMMLGFGAGGLAMGKLADKWGVHVALWIGAVGVGSGFVLAGLSPNICRIEISCCSLGCLLENAHQLARMHSFTFH